MRDANDLPSTRAAVSVWARWAPLALACAALSGILLWNLGRLWISHSSHPLLAWRPTTIYYSEIPRKAAPPARKSPAPRAAVRPRPAATAPSEPIPDLGSAALLALLSPEPDGRSGGPVHQNEARRIALAPPKAPVSVPARPVLPDPAVARTAPIPPAPRSRVAVVPADGSIAGNAARLAESIVARQDWTTLAARVREGVRRGTEGPARVVTTGPDGSSIEINMPELAGLFEGLSAEAKAELLQDMRQEMLSYYEKEKHPDDNAATKGLLKAPQQADPTAEKTGDLKLSFPDGVGVNATGTEAGPKLYLRFRQFAVLPGHDPA